ncbi:MAG: molybdate ABC transporter substrate-binding protein [Bradyrhizobium sp.]|nr:molybdate ABC transporter substrate-binding protein [Bradyrhizobium sp.]
MSERRLASRRSKRPQSGKEKSMSRTILKNAVQGIGLASVLAMSPFAAHATTTINVAAAANLTIPFGDIIPNFQNQYASSGYMVSVSYASSSVLESQINGTCSGCTPNQPGYDLFLSADTNHPNDLINNYPSTVYAYNSPTTPAKYLFYYAVGALDLWTNTSGINVSSGLPAGWLKVAIADPSKAPYGVAAQSVLSNVYSITLPNAKVDEYSNITNTYNSVQSGSEKYGFVARSQICTHGDTTPQYSGVSHQDIAASTATPPTTYSPILQGGVEIAHTRTTDQQTELTVFVQYLTGSDFSNNPVSPSATKKLQYYCYTLPSPVYP